MPRLNLIELHDHPRFPVSLRDLITDALEALWQFGNSYKPILGLLHEGLTASGEEPIRVLDLCSGGGGPWLRLAQQLEEDYNCPIEVCLTDKYPNQEAIGRIVTRSRSGPRPAVGFEPQTAEQAMRADSRFRIDFSRHSVDALDVPTAGSGFRTMFSSFHHFNPSQARRLLASAMASGRGIGIFEVAQRGPRTMLILCFTPFLVLFLTPWMRPFRWSRLLWTYLIPVVPFVIWFDGWASCMRTYSKDELEEMVKEVSQQQSAVPYYWQTGEARTGLLPVTYVVGYPSTKGRSGSPRESKLRAMASDGDRRSEAELAF